MKKFFIIIAIIIAFIIGAALLIPVIFKDDIRKQISTTLDQSLNAEVYFDFDKFNLSMFSHFPNPTASLSDFGISGRDVFSKDTLVDVQQFEVTIDLFSLFGDKIKINSIYLNEPDIYVKVLKDGTANYDIAVESGEEIEADTDTSSSDIKIGIESWEINNGNLIYDDESTQMKVRLKGIQHHGSGDFTLSVFDMATTTEIQATSFEMEGIEYLSDKQVNANITLLMDMDQMRFEFKDNMIKVNDFPLAFEGFFAMPEDKMDMDIRFSSPEASIKSLYSLVPGAFTEGYEDVQASGSLSFEGYVKGSMTEETLPSFHLEAKADNGLIQYPELPASLKNISLDMLVDNPDGNIDHTLLDIKKFHVDFGANPFDMMLKVKNLVDYDMEAALKGSLNLGQIIQFYPVEGLDMKGVFSMDFTAHGVYDSIQNTIPAFQGTMKMTDGYIKSSEFPEALEKMNFNASATCASGKMQDAKIEVAQFSMTMDNEPFEASLLLQNFDDYQWDLAANGTINLGMINDFYPIEDMSYKGKVVAHIQTKGRYSSVEAEKYDELPTSGNVVLSDFEFMSVDLPQPLKMPRTEVAFTPEKLNIKECSATLGASDFSFSGYIDNYIDYTFQDNALLHGQLSMTSNVIDLNEFMTGESTDPEQTEEVDTAAMETIKVPENIDMTFASTIDRIYYEKMTLQNAQGEIIINNGTLNMKGLQFDALGGQIVMNGVYDTKSYEKAAFSYDLGINSISIPTTFKSFSTVQKFAPMAALMEGDFSSDFKISGLLGNDMMPLYESIQGAGIINIQEAVLKKSKLSSSINSLTKLNLSDNNIDLKDIILNASIEDGRAKVQPFELNIGGQQAIIGGSMGIDGSLDYALNTEIETGQYGQSVNNIISNLTGSDSKAVGDKLNLTFNIGGTYDDPKIQLAKASSEGDAADDAKSTIEEEKEALKAQAKDEVKEKSEALKTEAEKELNEALESLKENNKEDLSKKADELQQSLDSAKLPSETEKAVEDAKKNLENLFKKKKKDN